jgi:hypothetical protein
MEVVLNIILMIHNNKPQVQTGNLLVSSKPSAFRDKPKIKITKIPVTPVGIWFWGIEVTRLLEIHINHWLGWLIGSRWQQLFKLIHKARNMVVSLWGCLLLWRSGDNSRGILLGSKGTGTRESSDMEQDR